ncbi:hypothetical protein BC834DRAFT_402744 [Gloeopeniophorella convolvens]|nr:hypothetical protein BC834DRAFT_402744 [Gloeopeniophorella convolvens]
MTAEGRYGRALHGPPSVLPCSPAQNPMATGLPRTSAWDACGASLHSRPHLRPAISSIQPQAPLISVLASFAADAFLAQHPSSCAPMPYICGGVCQPEWPECIAARILRGSVIPLEAKLISSASSPARKLSLLTGRTNMSYSATRISALVVVSTTPQTA